MTLEDQIKALLEANEKKDAEAAGDDKEPADHVDPEPAVKIENPMDPNLTSSDVANSPQDEINAAETQGAADVAAEQGLRNQEDDESDDKKKGVAEAYGDDHDGEFQSPADANSSGLYRFGSHSALSNRYGENGKVANTSWSNAHSKGASMFAAHGPANVVHHDGQVYQANMQTKKFHDAQDQVVPSDSEVNRKYGFIFGGKHAVEESIADLLGNEFSDEFKLKAQTIFEAAVKDQVLQIQEKLQEEHQAAVAVLEDKFQEKLATRSQQLDEENSDKIDGYLNFLAEEWKKDNQIALESAIKTELTESFITQLKSVFEQHYFDLPEEKVDAYAKALEEKAEVESALATTVGSLKKLTEELNQIRREQIIAESTKDLAGLDATRLVALTEDFAFEDAETFKQKVSIVKTQFFGKKSSQAKEQLTEELTKSTPIVEEVTAVETVQEGNAMSAYVKALRK